MAGWRICRQPGQHADRQQCPGQDQFLGGLHIHTDTNSFFDTQIAIPAGSIPWKPLDPATGLRGKATAKVAAGITNYVTVHLLAKDRWESRCCWRMALPPLMPRWKCARQLSERSLSGKLRPMAFCSSRTFSRVLTPFPPAWWSGSARPRPLRVIVPSGAPASTTVHLAASGTFAVVSARDWVTPVTFAQCRSAIWFCRNDRTAVSTDGSSTGNLPDRGPGRRHGDRRVTTAT